MKDNNFNGFLSQSIDFLWGIGLNNNKQWLDEHRHEYKKYLFEPMKILAKEIEEYINSLNKDILCTSTISRINRDVRFSNNKNPYKESIWFTLKPDYEKWQNRPVYFFEISATGYTYGMGYYIAESQTMAKFRKTIDENSQKFDKIINDFLKQNKFIIEGDKYKKKFNVNHSDEIMNWYTRKNINIICHHDIDKLIFSTELVNVLKNDFNSINYIYRYMWSLHKALQND